MNPIIGEQLMAAQMARMQAMNAEKEARENDINLFVWKGAKDSNHEQKEIRLVDADEEQLKSFLRHCNSMLYNIDRDNPGRYTLLEIIIDQRLRCNAELFLRWLENTYEIDNPERRAMKRSTYLDSLTTFINSNLDTLPKDYNNLSITEFTNGVPTEFNNLPVKYVIDACMGRLGRFDKKHMTLKFIATKLGMWFTQEEMNEFTVEAKKAGKSRIELVKDRCGLKPNISITVKDNKVLNFKEFRALVQLKSKNYKDMTTDQLLVLRNKGLYGLYEEVTHHIQQWERIIGQIRKVAEFKGYNL